MREHLPQPGENRNSDAISRYLPRHDRNDCLFAGGQSSQA
jgi:hypothetical protein